MKKVNLLLVLFFLMTGLQAQTYYFRENLLFTSAIEGSQMVPASATNAHGIGTFMLNKKRDSLSVNISVNGFTPTFAAIYQGKTGENGTLFLDLSSFIAGKRISTIIKGTNVTSNISKLVGEDLYLLVGSAANPMGEIRGQLTLEADPHFVADLKGTEAIPTVISSAFGLGSFVLSLDKSKLEFKVICKGLSGAITSVKLHTGALGISGAEIADLTTFVSGNAVLGNILLSNLFLTSLFAGEIYLNISTIANPTGEIRSQIRKYKGLAFDTYATGPQLVPALSNNAKAVGVFRLSPKLDTFFYDVVVDGLSSSLDYSHLHVGNYGEPYDALQVDFTSSIVGNRIKGFKKGTGVTATTINKLLSGNLALIVHTANNPNGEVRGQVTRLAREGFTIKIDAAQSVPSVASEGQGVGFVSLGREEDHVHFGFVANDLSSTVTGAHFHFNTIGQTGNVVYDLTDKIEVSGTEVSASGFWKNTDNNPFLPANVIELKNNTLYLNLHTTNNPNGEIRGQVLGGTVFYAGTSPVQEVFETNNFEISITPNPAQSSFQMQIEGAFSDKYLIKMVDMLGKVVFLTYNTSNSGFLNTSIDVSKLNAGVFVLTVSDGKNAVSKKVVIKA
jgi:hypothetical protein